MSIEKGRDHYTSMTEAVQFKGKSNMVEEVTSQKKGGKVRNEGEKEDAY